MVNFNNETTVSTPAANLIKLLLIEARYNTFLAIETYNNKISNGVNSDQALVKSRLGIWYLEHQAYLDRVFNKQDDVTFLKAVKKDLFFNKKSLSYDRLIEIIEFLNNVMDKLRITKLDTKQQYDTTDIEADNLANEYS